MPSGSRHLVLDVESGPPVVGGPEAPVAAGGELEDVVGVVVAEEEVVVERVVADAHRLLRPRQRGARGLQCAGAGGLEEVRARVDAHLVDLAVGDEQPVGRGEIGDARGVGARRVVRRGGDHADVARRDDVVRGQPVLLERGLQHRAVRAGLAGVGDEQSLHRRVVGGIAGGREGDVLYVDQVDLVGGVRDEHVAVLVERQHLLGGHVEGEELSGRCGWLVSPRSSWDEGTSTWARSTSPSSSIRRSAPSTSATRSPSRSVGEAIRIGETREVARLEPRHAPPQASAADRDRAGLRDDGGTTRLWVHDQAACTDVPGQSNPADEVLVTGEGGDPAASLRRLRGDQGAEASRSSPGRLARRSRSCPAPWHERASARSSSPASPPPRQEG